jgi:hypothetical protein
MPAKNISNELCQLDTELHLEFQLYAGSAFKKCRGRVAWVNRMGSLKKDYATAGMGIEFIEINKLDILSIQSFIRNE